MKADEPLLNRLADVRLLALSNVEATCEEAVMEIIRLRKALTEIAVIAKESTSYATPAYQIEQVACWALATDPHEEEE